ncbi:hypothetical protein WA158_001598 [Blastocystis sp. Blastoise]
MEVIQQLHSGHKEFINDTAFDYYMKRMASCSADGMICIWRKDGNNQWVFENSIKAHTSLISKIEWAHPIFGSMLVACLYNSGFKLFEEQVSFDGSSSWNCVYESCRNLKSPCDVSFCPHKFGLKIATATLEGKILIESPLNSINETWTTMSTIRLDSECYCISWSKDIRQEDMTIAVGTKQDAQIWSLDHTTNEWKQLYILKGHGGIVRSVSWANNIGHSFERIATGCSDGLVRIYEIDQNGATLKASLEGHKKPVWKVEWNVTGTLLASSGDNNSVRIWKQKSDKSWYCCSEVTNNKPDIVSK